MVMTIDERLAQIEAKIDNASEVAYNNFKYLGGGESELEDRDTSAEEDMIWLIKAVREMKESNIQKNFTIEKERVDKENLLEEVTFMGSLSRTQLQNLTNQSEGNPNLKEMLVAVAKQGEA